jgi:hypothetical protein
MTQGLRHEEMQELLPAAALEILDGAELDQLLVHLGECAECTGLLREYREVAASLALLAPAVGMEPSRSAALRRRLMARVQADRGTRAARVLRVDRWMGWLVAASLAGVLLVHHSVHRTVDYGWLAAGILTFVLVGLGVYARIQQRRASLLRERLAEQERKNSVRS